MSEPEAAPQGEIAPQCRYKFRCDSKDETTGKVKFSAVVGGSPENRSFFKWTPTGSLSFSTFNKPVLDKFQVGKEYYLDLTPAN